MKRFLHQFGYLICVALLLILCGQSQAQQPIKQTLKRVQTGVQKICYGDRCELVPTYGYVQVAEPNCDQPPPALPIVTPDCQCVDCTCDPCNCPPLAPTATVDELAAVQQRMTFSRPLRSWVESRPVMRLFAAKPLRSFLRRIFVR
jgi:hypothetical protein